MTVMTIRELIQEIIRQCDDLDDIIVVRNKEGEVIHDVSINTVKGSGLGALFG